MLTVFIRAAALYFIIVLCVRLMGKRQLGELQPSELVITILVSNIATLPVEDPSIPMLLGIVPILTLVSLDVIISYLSLHSSTLRKFMSGKAKIVISNGVIDQSALKALRFSPDDLMESLRAEQVFDVNEVQFAVVETTGRLSVCLKKQFSPLTAGDLVPEEQETDPPLMVINSGKASPEALRRLGFDLNWLKNRLKAEKVTCPEVYIMTADREGSYTIIKRTDLRR